LPTIPSQRAFRLAAAIVAVLPLLALLVVLLLSAIPFTSPFDMTAHYHALDLSTHTYFDVKVQPEAVDQVLASTRTAAASENGSLAGVEYIGHVGELKNHLLYRVSKQQPPPNRAQQTTATTNHLDPLPSSSLQEPDWAEQRNRQIVDAISAVQGVLHVDIQTPRQRTKKDEL